MTDKPEPGLVALARLAGEVSQAVIEAEVQALQLVQAEVDALGNLALVPGPRPETEAERKAREAEVEEGFDNMPV